MTRTTFRIACVTTIAIAATLTLSACSTNVTSTTPTSTPVAMAMMSDDDIMFAQMMIPHHQQAVEMSTLAETHTTNQDLLALARTIKDAQTPEIAQMTAWLTDAGAPLSMGHTMGDDGMLSDDEMMALANTNGASFDKLYLTGMIAHHQGAIAMAKSIANTTNPDVKALSDAIIASQTAEIDKMTAMLSAL